MFTVHADGAVIYDSNLDGYELQSVEVTVGVNKAGTATIVLPASHYAYNRFMSQRTVITIHQDGELLFRGRVLYQTDDWDRSRTLTCEGERCFFCDSILEPYLYQTDPAVIFSDLVRRHNEQVDDFKRFEVGAITAKDPNGYVRLESESAEQISDVIDKLVERVGGYITFTTNGDGQRTVNWLASLDRECGQVIEFGENLLDYSATGANSDLATVIYPYGAKDEVTGERVTIEAVNDGKRYVQDDEAIALRGRIAKTITWDDVTLASNLLTKARQQLETSKLLVTTLQVSAVDLSTMDKSIDALRVGDMVRVKSEPHGVNDVFQLTERTYNLFDPALDTVVLGKDCTTLTNADVAGDKRIQEQLRSTAQGIKTDYTISINDAVAAVQKSTSGGSSGGGGESGGGSTTIIQGSAANLLDNSYFVDPINQREGTNYTQYYSIDRWCIPTLDGELVTKMEVVTGGITISATGEWQEPPVYQLLEADTSGTFTAALCDASGKISCASGAISAGAIESGAVRCEVRNDGLIKFSITAAGTYKWAALYRGTYTTSTLPAYEQKPRGAEMLECRRYFRAIRGGALTGFMASGTCIFGMPIEVPMRTTPSIEREFAYGTIRVAAKSIPVTGISVSVQYPNALLFGITYDNTTYTGLNNNAGVLASGASFWITADLM